MRFSSSLSGNGHVSLARYRVDRDDDDLLDGEASLHLNLATVDDARLKRRSARPS
jgi:hypothetical protein